MQMPRKVAELLSQLMARYGGALHRRARRWQKDLVFRSRLNSVSYTAGQALDAAGKYRKP
jgi:hypothetical protein